MKPASLRALLLCAATVSACDPFHTGFDDSEGAVAYRAHDEKPAPDPTRPLRVMNYNVKFGGGRIDFFFDCFGIAATIFPARQSI